MSKPQTSGSIQQYNFKIENDFSEIHLNERRSTLKTSRFSHKTLVRFLSANEKVHLMMIKHDLIVLMKMLNFNLIYQIFCDLNIDAHDCPQFNENFVHGGKLKSCKQSMES